MSKYFPFTCIEGRPSISVQLSTTQTSPPLHMPAFFPLLKRTFRQNSEFLMQTLHNFLRVFRAEVKHQEWMSGMLPRFKSHVLGRTELTTGVQIQLGRQIKAPITAHTSNFTLNAVQNLKFETRIHSFIILLTWKSYWGSKDVSHFRWSDKLYIFTRRCTQMDKTTEEGVLRGVFEIFISKCQRHNSDMVRSLNYSWPQSAMVIFFDVLPLSEPYDSIFVTTSKPLTTLPNTTCFPSNLKDKKLGQHV